MDLEQMKQVWSTVNDQLATQQLINRKLLLKITQEQSNNRLNKIMFYEFLTQFFNWALIVYILTRWQYLDNLFLQIGAVFMTVITVFFSYLCYLLYDKIIQIDIQKKTLVEVLKAVGQYKRFYYQYKKTTIFLIALGMFFCIPILIKLLHNNDILDHLTYYTLPIIFSLVVGFGMLFIIYKKLHEKNIQEVENLLKELDNLD